MRLILSLSQTLGTEGTVTPSRPTSAHRNAHKDKHPHTSLALTLKISKKKKKRTEHEQLKNEAFQFRVELS